MDVPRGRGPGQAAAERVRHLVVGEEHGQGVVAEEVLQAGSAHLQHLAGVVVGDQHGGAAVAGGVAVITLPRPDLVVGDLSGASGRVAQDCSSFDGVHRGDEPPALIVGRLPGDRHVEAVHGDRQSTRRLTDARRRDRGQFDPAGEPLPYGPLLQLGQLRPSGGQLVAVEEPRVDTVGLEGVDIVHAHRPHAR